MKVTSTEIPEVLVLEPRVFEDDRGFFLESFNERTFTEKTGLAVSFVQDNHSRSTKNVLRGLHYQTQQAQGKLVRVTAGKILDVAVDLRSSSQTFGRWIAVELSAENKHQLWIPPGFAHGFLVLSEIAEVQYKATEYYAPQHERSLLWNDPDLSIPWVLDNDPIISTKDQNGMPLREAEVY